MASTEDKERPSSVYAGDKFYKKTKPKINIDGFLYIKDKSCDDLHYWVCKRKGQNQLRGTARATTICIAHQNKMKVSLLKMSPTPSPSPTLNILW